MSLLQLLARNLVWRAMEWWTRRMPIGQVGPRWLTEKCRDADW